MIFKFCFFFRYIFDLFPKLCHTSFFHLSDGGLYFDSSSAFLFFQILKLHSFFQFKQLIGLSIVAPYFLPEFTKSFSLNYFLLSLPLNFRLIFKCLLLQEQNVDSLTLLFKSAGWSEREAWDLYGIFFSNNFDLRRILTDYGFIGYPLRKDFPITGFLELRYEEFGKRIRYLPVSLAQEFRNFTLSSAWENK